MIRGVKKSSKSKVEAAVVAEDGAGVDADAEGGGVAAEFRCEWGIGAFDKEVALPLLVGERFGVGAPSLEESGEDAVGEGAGGLSLDAEMVGDESVVLEFYDAVVVVER